MALPYSYVATVPQGTQQINNTQQPINGNFQDIYDLLAINHIPFNTANTFGRHSYVSYVEQGSDPSTASNEIALYSKVISDTNGAELFYRYPNNGSIVQLTGNSNSGSSGNTSGDSFAISGVVPGGTMVSGFWQYLPGNILYMSGLIANTVSSNPFTITFPVGTSTTGLTIPQFTQPPFNIQVTASQAQSPSSGATIAAIVTSKTTASCYYSKSISGSTVIPGIYVTLIGV